MKDFEEFRRREGPGTSIPVNFRRSGASEPRTQRGESKRYQPKVSGSQFPHIDRYSKNGRMARSTEGLRGLEPQNLIEKPREISARGLYGEEIREHSARGASTDPGSRPLAEKCRENVARRAPEMLEPGHPARRSKEPCQKTAGNLGSGPLRR